MARIAVFLMCFACVAAAVARADKPNVVLIMADDQGWGDVSYNGNPVLKTPELDAMAAAGLRFDRFYAAAPVCSPTRASVMTGRHPNRLGCFKWGYTLRPREVTIAEALKGAGYATGHFGKWHLGSCRADNAYNPGANGFDRWVSAPNFYDNDPVLSAGGKAVQLKGESSMVAADAAVEFMRDQARAKTPFLAVVWFGSPHSPHRSTPELKEPYAQHGKKADFYGEMAGIDAAVGKLRAALRELKIEKDTIVWYCSDNGGLYTDSSGGRAKKGSVYEGGLRVPGIVEWPGRIDAGRTTDAIANTADIYPTLLAIIGVDVEHQPTLDGVSLKPLIDGQTWKRPSGVGFWDAAAGGRGTPADALMTQLLREQRGEAEPAAKAPDDGSPNPTSWEAGDYRGHAAWLDWPWKLHRIEGKGGKVKWELYNLAEDPMEKADVSDDHGERVTQMRATLEKWLASVVGSMNGKDYAK